MISKYSHFCPAWIVTCATNVYSYHICGPNKLMAFAPSTFKTYTYSNRMPNSYEFTAMAKRTPVEFFIHHSTTQREWQSTHFRFALEIRTDLSFFSSVRITVYRIACKSFSTEKLKSDDRVSKANDKFIKFLLIKCHF